MQEYHNASIIRSVAMTTPAVRMVVVRIFPTIAPDRVEILDVVAITSTIKDKYDMISEDEESPGLADTPQGMKALGWDRVRPADDDEHLHFDAVVIDGDGELVEAGELSGFCKIVATPWPAEQDKDRLQGVIAELHGFVAKCEEACSAMANDEIAPRTKPRKGGPARRDVVPFRKGPAPK